MTTNVEGITVNISQLIRFNAVKNKRRSPTFTRHAKTNEPPLPVLIGLLVHAKTRTKSLIERLAAEA